MWEERESGSTVHHTAGRNLTTSQRQEHLSNLLPHKHFVFVFSQNLRLIPAQQGLEWEPVPRNEVNFVLSLC